MRRKIVLIVCVSALAGLGTAGSAGALPFVLDYTGFSWVTPDRQNPESIHAVGVVNGFSVPVPHPEETYTYCLSNLTLATVIDHSSTRHTYVYSGGEMSIFRSTGPADRGYDYGTYPMNLTSPSSFIDGVLWLGGDVNSFSFYFDDFLGVGGISAEGSFSEGEMAASLGPDDYFSFAGMTDRPGSGIPSGYHYRMDGQVESCVRPVPEPSVLALLCVGLAALVSLRSRKT